MEGYRYRVQVSPHRVDRSYGEFRPGQHHGVVMPGDWDQRTYPTTGNPLVRMAFAHWRDGLSWEETGAVAHQMERIRTHGSLYADGLRLHDDVLRRYERLDQLFELTRRTGEFPPQANAVDGIYIHLDREGRAVFGQRGVHRFVIATLLELEQVVAQLGAVHPLSPQARMFRLLPSRRLTALPPQTQDTDPRPPALRRVLRRRRLHPPTG